jgi:hypothetical protein
MKRDIQETPVTLEAKKVKCLMNRNSRRFEYLILLLDLKAHGRVNMKVALYLTNYL